MLFEKYADDYAQFRPAYPEKLLGRLLGRIALSAGSLILDLACGTGNLGRQVAALSGARVIGVDQSPVMLKRCGGLEVMCGRAEQLPLHGSLMDAVFVGQAFHWFDFRQAFSEIQRVLKGGGVLAIIWYRRRRPHDSHRARIDELVKSFNPDYRPDFMDCDWHKEFETTGGYGGVEDYTMDSSLSYRIADYLKLQRSKSYIGDALTPPALAQFLREAEAILREYYPRGELTEHLTFSYVSAVKV